MAFQARTWQQILTQIVAQVNTLIPALTSTSQAAYWRVWAFIQAVSQNLMEQRFTILQNELEATAAQAAPETAAWIQNRVLLFQYGNVIQIYTDLSISYPLPALPLIINNCAVVGNGSGGITIKVTSTSGLLSTAQENALLSYLDQILGADINFTVINALPDMLDIFGTVYYNGQYSGSIVLNVTDAINNYITNIGFNGTIKVSDIIDAIRGVVGVTDFVPNVIWAAANGTTYPTNGIYLMNGGQIISREYNTISGQIQLDGANPLSSSLTFTISNG
jgi:hypothetical protein